MTTADIRQRLKTQEMYDTMYQVGMALFVGCLALIVILVNAVASVIFFTTRF